MIYELRAYQLRPGGIPHYLDFFEAVGLPVISRYAELVGYFRTETGMLNRIVHLWRYRDRAHRAGQRAALLADREWQTAFLPHAMGMLLDQHSTILQLVPAFADPMPSTPAAAPRIYDLQIRSTAPADLARLIDHECRESVHRADWAWTAQSGDLGRLVELTAFDDEAERSARLAAVADAQRGRPPFQPEPKTERETLVPARFSPLS